jgi:hypothetical protein
MSASKLEGCVLGLHTYTARRPNLFIFVLSIVVVAPISLLCQSRALVSTTTIMPRQRKVVTQLVALVQTEQTNVADPAKAKKIKLVRQKHGNAHVWDPKASAGRD